MSNTGQLNLDKAACTSAINDLFERCEGVNAVMLAKRDGRPFVERSKITSDAGKFAAMSSSLLALGNSVLKELDGGALDHVLIEGQKGKLVIVSVPGSLGLLLLAVQATNEARLGMVLGHAKACATRISAII